MKVNFKRIGHFIYRHANLFLSIGSCAFIVASTVEAAKAGPKIQEALTDKRETKGADLTTAEKIETVAPLCTKTAIFAGAACASTIGALVMSENVIMAATGLAATAVAQKAQIVQQVKQVDPDIFIKTGYDKMREQLQNAPIPTVADEVLYWSEYFNEYFLAPEGIVPGVEARLNDRIRLYDYASAQDFRDYMHMSTASMNPNDTRYLKYLGWDQFSFMAFNNAELDRNPSAPRQGLCLNEEIMQLDDGMEVHYISWNVDPDKMTF